MTISKNIAHNCIKHLTLFLAVISCLLVASNTMAESDVRIIPMDNAKQPFEMAAKVQWNPHHKRWDKVLVMYNGAKEPPKNHPVWSYLAGLDIPKRGPIKAGENLAYKAFKMNAYCTANNAFSVGKPMLINFDSHKSGQYKDVDFLKDWNCPKWQIGRERATIVSGAQARNGKSSLLLRFPKGVAGCGRQKQGCYNWKPALGKPVESITYSYWVKFHKGFDYVLGGKLPGVGSIKGGTGGIKSNGANGWSVRLMWRREGELGQYIYHMDQPSNFGEFFEWDSSPPKQGEWHHIKTTVRMNTPGQRNGLVRSWLNGKEVLSLKQLRFRSNPQVKIKHFLFSSFFGGNGPKWSPHNGQLLYLDDFHITGK